MKALLFPLIVAPLVSQDDEARYYSLEHLQPPSGEVLEVGGLDTFADGRLVLTTRRGQVWIVDQLGAGETPRFSLFAEGLQEGLGATVVGEDLYVVQRGELSRLRDHDGDGRCDDIETITSDWGLSGNYHEFAYGLPVDAEGNFYVTLNVSFFSPEWWHGKSTVPYRGWALKISPEGNVTPFACGLRSPCGVSLDPEGRLFVTDNQGDWMPASPIFHVEEGRFYGHPASLDWTPEYRASQTLASDRIPPARAATDRADAALWLPYKWSRSPGNMVWIESEDFGPFQGQFLLAELTNGMILRGDVEEVEGQLQGWCVPFRQDVGSNVRLAFHGSTLYTGLTNRGWGGLPPADGVGRIRWTGETPMEVLDVELTSGGDEGAEVPCFLIGFTQPLATGTEPSVKITQYDYDYWWEYGSPERELVDLSTRVYRTSRPEWILVRADDLVAGRMARIRIEGAQAENGTPLLHPEVAYTVNRIHGRPAPKMPIAKIVPPPPARRSAEDGWLRLSYGDATSLWDFEGWELVDTELDPDDPTKLVTKPGVNALTNTASDAPTDYRSKLVFGDGKVHVEFMLPKGGRTALWVHGRYGLLLSDSEDASELTVEHCGAVMGTADSSGVPPSTHAYAGAGNWHKLDLNFRAARFDAEGNKTENARFQNVQLDGTTIHKRIEFAGPTAGAIADGEVELGPLVMGGTTGPVAIGNLRFKPTGARTQPAVDWVPLFDGETLAGWTANEEGTWYVEDEVLIGEGLRSHLFTDRDDFGDFELTAVMKISEGGNSGLYFRTQYTEAGWPKGYEAQVNSSFADPQKTGSLYNLAKITTHLVPADTWFDYHVTCRDTEAGTHIVIKVNGVVVTDFVDTERRHGPGRIALQQHHDGSVLEVRTLAIRPLD